MGQSATLYRVSVETFSRLKEKAQCQFEVSLAKDFETFDGSFMGLEYVLCKVDDGEKADIVAKIFNPILALSDADLEDLDHEEIFEAMEKREVISYLETSVICQLDDFLSKISDQKVLLYFDPEELNMSEVYPRVWHGDDSPEFAFNRRHFLEDFGKLKMLFRKASEEQDYILVFVG